MENQNAKLAESAYELCQAAYKEKDFDSARIYIVNAITHATELRFFKALVTIAKKTQYDKRRDVIEEFLNICSMALFQIPANEVQSVQQIISELQEVYDNTFVLDSNDVVNDDSIYTWGMMLENYSWNSLRKKNELSSIAKVQEKGRFLQKLLDSPVITEIQKKQIEHELQVCFSYLDYLTKESVLQESFSELEREFLTDGNVFYIAAKLQNLNSILAQMWLLEISDVIPRGKLHSELSAYAEKIEECEAKYNRLRSKSLYKTVSDKISDAMNKIRSASGNFTDRLEICQKIIQEASEALYELTAPEYVKEIQNALRQLTEEAEKISKKRLASYQAFCAAKCRSAIKSYDDTTGRVSENDALRYLDRWDIAKIDESLLSPEASAIFHEAKGILIDKLSRINKADYQIKCVTSEKFSLEDF